MTPQLLSRLGIERPIIQGPFGGTCSTVRLVAAVSNAGGLGSFGMHPRNGGNQPTAYLAAVRSQSVGLESRSGWRTSAARAAVLRMHETLRPYYAELGIEYPAPLEPKILYDSIVLWGPRDVGIAGAR